MSVASRTCTPTDSDGDRPTMDELESLECRVHSLFDSTHSACSRLTTRLSEHRREMATFVKHTTTILDSIAILNAKEAPKCYSPPPPTAAEPLPLSADTKNTMSSELEKGRCAELASFGADGDAKSPTELIQSALYDVSHKPDSDKLEARRRGPIRRLFHSLQSTRRSTDSPVIVNHQSS